MIDVNFRNIFNLANVNAQKVLDSLEDDTDKCSTGETSRKRKKLDDFTPQERIVRRKLKNRVAAQNARDRKKEKMAKLEEVVERLEKENENLVKSNAELKSKMDILMDQNEKLRVRLGLDENYLMEDEKTKCVQDHKHIIIKDEEELDAKHASLGISLPKKVQFLLISLIMTWLANPRLNTYLASLEKPQQQKVLKTLLRQKLISKMKARSKMMNNTVKQLLTTDLSPIIETCQWKMRTNCSNFVKTSNYLWKKEVIL